MKKMLLISAAWALCSIAIASTAHAQVMPEGASQQRQATPPSQQSATPILGRSPEDRIMVLGEAETINSRRTPPRPAREHQPSDVNTEFTYAEWVELSRRNGWPNPDQTFQERRQSNFQMCRETTVFIMLWADLEERFRALMPAIGELFPRVLGMRRDIIRAAQLSNGGSLLSPIVGGAVFTPGYGVVMATNVPGQIAQNGAHASQALDNRDATLVNLGITGINLEAQILNARGNVRYYEFMEDYCTEFLSGQRI
jgi:hypothetical protein